MPRRANRVDPVLLVGVFAAAYLGFALLALSQTRHWHRVVGSAPLSFGRVVMLRLTGAMLLVLSLALALLRDGPGFGALLWATAISLAALAVAFTLAWWPRRLASLARRFHRVPHSLENG